MSLLDKAIAYVSPSTALKREAARVALGQVQSSGKKLATMRGAMATRTDAPWSVSRSVLGGTSSQRLDYATMRDRGRRVYNEDVIGRTLLNVETDYVVGPGYTLQSKTSSAEFNKEVELLWWEWLEVADIRGLAGATELQRMSWREPRKDGDGAFLLTSEGFESRLQYIPGDKIGGSVYGRGYAAKNSGKPIIQDGIESNENGRPVRFHIEVENELGKFKNEPVPAADVVFLSHPLGPLDVRGCSCFAQIFEWLSHLYGYAEAVVIAGRMAAIFGLVFKEESGAKQLGQLPGILNSQGQATKAITLENGQVKYVGRDDQVVQVQASQPLQQSPDFIRAIFRLICQGFDMPLEIGAGDFSQVNFISGRLGLLRYKRTVQVKQMQLIPRCWNRIYQWWIARERKKQLLGLPTRFKSAIPAEAYLYEFHPPEFPVADPMAEGQAHLLEMSMGVKTPQMIAGAYQRDWAEMQVELKAARDSNEANGIPNVISTMAKVETEGQAKPAATEPDPNKEPSDGDDEAQDKDE